jgi:rhamnogalacturonan endolyase
VNGLEGAQPEVQSHAGDLRARGGALTRVWRWERPAGGGGYHNLRTGDIDGDGKDELVNGSIAIDHDGTEMWVTGEGHGDGMHMTDIDPNHRGLECRASIGELYNSKGGVIGPRPSSVNFAIWWDGDLLRELLDGTSITKHNGGGLLAAQGSLGSRNAPMGYGDILGDWREEVWYIYENKELRIYTTTIPATTRLYTLMHDADYRISVACEMVGYMQATQPSFHVGVDMDRPPPPAIRTPVRPVF